MSGFDLNRALFLDGVFIPGPGSDGSLVPPPGPDYVTGAVHFDGTTTSLALLSLAATDSSQLLYSYWFRSVSGSHSVQLVDEPTENNFSENNFSGQPETFASEVPFVSARIDFFSSVTAGAGWHHLLVAMDVGFADGSRPHAMYLDDVDVTTDDAVHSGGGAFTIAANGKTFNLFGDDTDFVVGDVADFWWGLNQYLDIGITANRRKFISATLKPVDLGDDGSTPTGTSPTFYLRRVPSVGTASDFKTDKTTNNNDFTETGTLTDASSSPTD